MRTSFSGLHTRQKRRCGGSRDRGCKGHRILRRVLVGGRFLGSSRAILFHERVVTAVSAAPSRGESRNEPHGARREWTREGGPIPTEEGEATEESEARSNRAPWEDNAHARRTSSVVRSPPCGAQASACSQAIRRSGLGCRETPGPPVMSNGAQTPQDVHAVKAAAVSRERARYGYTQIVQVAEVGRTHRASCPLGGRKASW